MGVTTHPEINQRDLRNRSKEIMDGVELGQTFTVTRDGRAIGELVPLRQRRRFVSREDLRRLAALSPGFSPEHLREEQDRVVDSALTDPYDR